MGSLAQTPQVTHDGRGIMVDATAPAQAALRPIVDLMQPGHEMHDSRRYSVQLPQPDCRQTSALYGAPKGPEEVIQRDSATDLGSAQYSYYTSEQRPAIESFERRACLDQSPRQVASQTYPPLSQPLRRQSIQMGAEARRDSAPAKRGFESQTPSQFDSRVAHGGQSFSRPRGEPGRALASPFHASSYTPGHAPFFMSNHFEHQSGKARKRSNLPKQSTEIMKAWFDQVSAHSIQ